MTFLSEFFSYLSARGKFWLLPILLFLVVFGGLIAVSHGTAVAPFIYTLF